MIEGWSIVLDIVMLLTTAMLLGVVFERLKQSAIVGYLITGMVLGPGALNWVGNDTVISGMAELGVFLLLFTIGLEFSWKRLRSLGSVALGGGTAQILITTLLVAGVAMLLGLGKKEALAVGLLVAPSSTAGVLRMLSERAEVDSMHGRASIGILLLQDIALVPMVLVMSMLAGSAQVVSPWLGLARSMGVTLVVFASFYCISNYFLPKLLVATALSRNRELPILLAVATCMGATWICHLLDVSPALGAFIAGMLLAESPFATQLRADVGAFRTVFVTLFFVSIGMLADLAWIGHHLPLLITVVGVIVLGKTAVTTGAVKPFRQPMRHAVATGLSTAQIGEFSFLLGQIAFAGGVLHPDRYRMLVSATVATLLMTPFLVAAAPRAGKRMEDWFRILIPGLRPSLGSVNPASLLRDHVIVVGFGPAGRGAAESLRRMNFPVVVVDLNPRTIPQARERGFLAALGDAAHSEILTHIHVGSARAVVVTLPDHRAVIEVIQKVRALAPNARILARSRYHIYAEDIARAGADFVIDEEERMGGLLGEEILRQL